MFYKNSWTNPWFDISRGNMNPNTPNIGFVWERGYYTINWANTIIEQLEAKKDIIDPEFAKMVAGEAHFVRAIAYLRLTSLYGAVPFIDRIFTPTESKLPRTSVNDITNRLIVPDLNIAIANLGELPYQLKWGKATKQAAMGMKVRALLYNNDYQGTVAAADSLMAFEKVSRVEFVSKYDTIFANNNENNGEILFSIKYLAGGYKQGGSFSTPFGPKKIPTLSTASINGSWSTSSIAPEFIDSYYMKDGLPASQSPLYLASKPWANRGVRFESTFYIGGLSVIGGKPFTSAMVGVNALSDYVTKYPF
ncbi:MAG: RagB/SusD family nutrient uptake outer membrane protein, partial [Bacteroidia bacterium]|nr:RagB/SusD family nutrient uptake outer membrane protein [Bacteroidia bacterium]